ncbi:MAG TPA: TonB-dependent receptor [Telluria sp.]|nr:TonB-dependent receptor [Telluria sp.]
MICLGGAAVGMQAAYAQTAETPVQPIARVEVTGSRLASPNAESASPLQVLTAADIAASGAVNLQDLLQKNPTMGTPALSRTNSNFLTSGGGVSTVNLRNLGDSRTLVLVNGRRFVSGVPGDTAVDLNTIPVDFIERVELLTGGASATYGSDAVAGVVNIILKRNFNGILLDASNGRSSHGDDLKNKVALTWGVTSDDGASNIMTHFGYSKQGAVFSRDRAASAIDQTSVGASVTGDAADLFTIKQPFYSSFAPQGRFFPTPSSSFTYDKNGNVIPFSTNGTATLAATGFNRSAYRTIAVPTERFLFATSGNLKINENHSAFLEGTYAQTKVDTNIEPYPLDSVSIYPASAGRVPAEFLVNGVLTKNPIVPANLYASAVDTDGDGLKDYGFTRRLAEFGPRHSTVDRGTMRLATGLKGTVFGDWNYEAFVAYGRTTEAQNSTGQVNVLTMRSALEAIPGANGPVCRDAQAVAQGCVPINIFGYNTISPEALKYVTAPGSLATAITQKLAGASISGEVFQLPAGKIGIAAGMEYRNEDSSSVSDPLTQAGLNAGNATPPTYGSYNVKEVYVETRIPLLKDVPFAKNLDARGSFRHGDYSTVGNANSWNAGLEWSPISDLKFRGTRAVSTRAPNINELYSPPSQDFPSGLVDPCQGVTATSSDARSVACRAAPGVNANIAANGGVFTLTQADQQGVSGYNRGNPDLKAEKGRSTTIGMVITPRSIPMLNKFTFTADYFNIKIADAIVSTERQYALAQCYGGGNSSYCSFVTRRPTAEGPASPGSIKFSDTAVSNSGGLATEGIDMTLSWADRVGPGRLSSQLSYTYLKTLYTKATPEADKNEAAGELESPRNKAVLNLAYKMGAFGISSSTSYTGRSSLDDQFLVNFDNPDKAAKIGSYVTTDFQLTYDVKKTIQVYFGMNNAFDKKAPRVISGLPGDSTGTETDASAYDPIGRRYYIGARVQL